MLDQAFRRTSIYLLNLNVAGTIAISYLVQVWFARGSLTPVIASTTEDFPAK